MRKQAWKLLSGLLAAVLLGGLLAGCALLLETPVPGPSETAVETPVESPESDVRVVEDGRYTSKEEVALYLHRYGHLPTNYLTKRMAEDRGWRASAGNLWEVTEEMSIGGDRFGNREGLLPAKEGRQYFEADINYGGGFRGAERLVYSNDGLIYYTSDHYASFELLYGEVEE